MAAESSLVLEGQAGVPRWGYRQRLLFCACALGVLVVLYQQPLLGLIRLALTNDLYSHTLLVPLITAYLAWGRRAELQKTRVFGSPGLALAASFAGLGPLAFYWAVTRAFGRELGAQDSLFLLLGSFLLVATGCGLFLLGRGWMRLVAFPLALLVFMLPLPKAVEVSLEWFFQHASADVAAALFSASATPMVWQGLVFDLPGITLEVAEECSGLRSSLVLFITSWIAGYLFLRSPWKRLFLAASVVPLACLRNGFRIFTIGMLCVHVSPGMIHSWIHRKGGPVFFALSLVPFFLILLWLRRSEVRRLERLKKGG